MSHFWRTLYPEQRSGYRPLFYVYPDLYPAFQIVTAGRIWQLAGRAAWENPTDPWNYGLAADYLEQFPESDLDTVKVAHLRGAAQLLRERFGPDPAPVPA